MATSRPYTYPGAPLQVDGLGDIEVRTDGDIEFCVTAPDHSTYRACEIDVYKFVSREDWKALVAFVAAEHERIDGGAS